MNDIITVLSEERIFTSPADVFRVVIRIGTKATDKREIYLTPNGQGGYNIQVIDLRMG